MIYLFLHGMSPTHWEVTDVGDISILNPLQTVVAACGQGRFCVRWDADKVRSSWVSSVYVPVRIVLLVVRYGKLGMRGLDGLSHRRAAWSPVRRGRNGRVWTSRLGAGRARVVERTGLRGATIDEVRRFKGWIDTEVGLT